MESKLSWSCFLLRLLFWNPSTTSGLRTLHSHSCLFAQPNHLHCIICGALLGSGSSEFCLLRLSSFCFSVLDLWPVARSLGFPLLWFFVFLAWRLYCYRWQQCCCVMLVSVLPTLFSPDTAQQTPTQEATILNSPAPCSCELHCSTVPHTKSSPSPFSNICLLLFNNAWLEFWVL